MTDLGLYTLFNDIIPLAHNTLQRKQQDSCHWSIGHSQHRLHVGKVSGHDVTIWEKHIHFHCPPLSGKTAPSTLYRMITESHTLSLTSPIYFLHHPHEASSWKTYSENCACPAANRIDGYASEADCNKPQFADNRIHELVHRPPWTISSPILRNDTTKRQPIP